MNLSHCLTTTTVAFAKAFKEDSVRIKFFDQREKKIKGDQAKRVLNQVERLRRRARVDVPVKVVSHNSFPADAGIASSAAAFSALTLALVGALDLEVSRKELSILTRKAGSGSACRSIPGGFVQWRKGHDSESSYAVQLHDEHWWDLRDIVVVVKDGAKKVSSLSGHQLAETSPYFSARLKELPMRIKQVKQALKAKDFERLGRLIEQEAVSLHVVAMTSQPPVFYWNQGTLQVMQALRNWRERGLSGYFTMDAGPNVHVICRRQERIELDKRLRRLSSVKFTIINRPARGARLVKTHLF